MILQNPGVNSTVSPLPDAVALKNGAVPLIIGVAEGNDAELLNTVTGVPEGKVPLKVEFVVLSILEDVGYGGFDKCGGSCCLV